jgi:hypothetical protein
MAAPGARDLQELLPPPGGRESRGGGAQVVGQRSRGWGGERETGEGGREELKKERLTYGSYGLVVGMESWNIEVD